MAGGERALVSSSAFAGEQCFRLRGRVAAAEARQEQPGSRRARRPPPLRLPADERGLAGGCAGAHTLPACGYPRSTRNTAWVSERQRAGQSGGGQGAALSAGSASRGGAPSPGGRGGGHAARVSGLVALSLRRGRRSQPHPLAAAQGSEAAARPPNPGGRSASPRRVEWKSWYYVRNKAP